MRRLTIIALLLIAGHVSAGEQVISVQHDSVRGVTCWILNNTGISCLPDGSLQTQQKATPSNQTAQASQTGSVVENSALQAGQNPNDERFQL